MKGQQIEEIESLGCRKSGIGNQIYNTQTKDQGLAGEVVSDNFNFPEVFAEVLEVMKGGNE